MTATLLLVLALLVVLAAVSRADDAALLRRVAEGDTRALASLHRAHAGRVLAVAQRVLRSRAEAEEILQDTFLEVWRRAGAFDPARGKVGSWIALIARSRSLDRLRSRAAAAKLEASQEQPTEPAGSSPVETLERKERRARVRAALEALGAEARQLVELAFYEGLSHSELAARTGTPLGTVKARLRRAFAQLGEALEGGAP